MLDLNFILENKDLVAQNAAKRGIEVDVARVESLALERKRIVKEIEDLRLRQKEVSARIPQAINREELIREASQLKKKLKSLSKKLEKLEPRLKSELLKIPNLTHPEAPVGTSEEDNKVIKEVGRKPRFSFAPKTHLELTKELDLVDFERAAKVTGQKFYYLKNEAVLLEFALVQYAFDLLLREGFQPYLTPDLARDEIILGAGFTPRGPESQIYYISDLPLGLIATAEITLAGLYSKEALDEKELPKKIVGFSHCFRREAGTYGQESKGLYRVHQFSKVEMFVYCLPEDSDKMHQYILSLEEKIFQGLGIPYRVVDCCTAELGGPAYRKFDLEAWLPGSNQWGEITSTSNTTDYQARRLGIKVKRENGKREYLHMLNGTAIAVSRAIIAILENFQQKDGSVKIPKVLHKWLPFKEIRRKE